MKDYNQIELQAQPPLLFDALDEVRLFLPKDRPDFCVGLLYDDGTGRKRQEMVSIAALPDWFNQKANLTRDLWISQHIFRPGKHRRIEDLRLLTMAHVDLDVYKLPEDSWASGRSPEEQAQSFMAICDMEEVPRPSYIVFSGRGLQAKWIFDRPIPKRALPRWNALQQALVKKFKDYGADPAASDAARVMRVVRSVNSRSLEIVRVVGVTIDENSKIQRYGFDYLAEFILPKGRPQKVQNRVAFSSEQPQVKSGLRANRITRSKTKSGFDFNLLNNYRLEDLRKLLTLRGGIGEGKRMIFLMLYMNSLTLAGKVTMKTFKSTAEQIAREIDPAWTPDLGELRTVFAKFRMHISGERTEFGGRKYPHLYTYKTETIINLLEITEEEQEQLQTLVGKAVKRERQRKAQSLSRRAAGVMPRDEYLGQASARKERAIALRRKGYTIRAIAAEMGLSVGAVCGYVKGVEPEKNEASQVPADECSKSFAIARLAKPIGGRRLVGGSIFPSSNLLIASSGGGTGEGNPPPRGVPQGVDPPDVHDARDWPRLKTPKP